MQQGYGVRKEPPLLYINPRSEAKQTHFYQDILLQYHQIPTSYLPPFHLVFELSYQ